MSIFGWSYPAGCDGPPDGHDYYPSWHDELITLLEEHNEVKQETIDKIFNMLMNDYYSYEGDEK